MSNNDSEAERTEMRCKKCGYDLRGLEEHRCPECGRTFDFTDLTSFRRFPFRGRRYLVLAAISSLLIVAPYGLAWLFEHGWIGAPRPGGRLIVLGPMTIIGGIVVTSYVAAISSRAVMGRLAWIEHRAEFVAALLLSGVNLIGFLGLMLLSLQRFLVPD